jgi:diaminohydroxyphosphoribosylaminopyrimidine deaminase/5-amino-6-(5-phosphoribosylamino)uracil reductase
VKSKKNEKHIPAETRGKMTKVKNILQEDFISRCLELATKGAGYVSPNPMVGCVIVKNGKIISEGYHKQFGASHAEVNAINSAKAGGINLRGSALYVNLEPCSHYGKTPPCTDEIIKNKIKEVCIGTKDPNPLVAGKGIKKLKKNGIKVTVGVLEDKCRETNKFYFKHIKQGLPYITLKAAQTLDGKIADLSGKSKWISSIESRKLVHELRSTYDAVLAGKNTVEHDNPELTVRHVKGRNPYRIVIDKDLAINLNNKLFSDKYTDKTIIIASKEPDEFLSHILEQRKIKVIKAKTKGGLIDIKDAMKKIAHLGIASVLIEGGAFTFTEFLRQKSADEIIIFISPKLMGKGIGTFKTDFKFDFTKAKQVSAGVSGNDFLLKIKL